MLYSELQCSEAIHKAVERMGFAEMTEMQEKTIPVMLAGRDVIAKAPTGTGKTCAFGIPVAEHIDPALKAPQAVIMAPPGSWPSRSLRSSRADLFYAGGAGGLRLRRCEHGKAGQAPGQRAARSWWRPRAASWTTTSTTTSTSTM